VSPAVVALKGILKCSMAAHFRIINTNCHVTHQCYPSSVRVVILLPRWTHLVSCSALPSGISTRSMAAHFCRISAPIAMSLFQLCKCCYFVTKGDSHHFLQHVTLTSISMCSMAAGHQHHHVTQRHYRVSVRVIILSLRQTHVISRSTLPSVHLNPRHAWLAAHSRTS
jgi:hypothetical protein